MTVWVVFIYAPYKILRVKQSTLDYLYPGLFQFLYFSSFNRPHFTGLGSGGIWIIQVFFNPTKWRLQPPQLHQDGRLQQIGNSFCYLTASLCCCADAERTTCIPIYSLTEGSNFASHRCYIFLCY